MRPSRSRMRSAFAHVPRAWPDCRARVGMDGDGVPTGSVPSSICFLRSATSRMYALGSDAPLGNTRKTVLDCPQSAKSYRARQNAAVPLTRIAGSSAPFGVLLLDDHASTIVWSTHGRVQTIFPPGDFQS